MIRPQLSSVSSHLFLPYSEGLTHAQLSWASDPNKETVSLLHSSHIDKTPSCTMLTFVLTMGFGLEGLRPDASAS